MSKPSHPHSEVADWVDVLRQAGPPQPSETLDNLILKAAVEHTEQRKKERAAKSKSAFFSNLISSFTGPWRFVPAMALILGGLMLGLMWRPIHENVSSGVLMASKTSAESEQPPTEANKLPEDEKIAALNKADHVENRAEFPPVVGMQTPSSVASGFTADSVMPQTPVAESSVPTEQVASAPKPITAPVPAPAPVSREHTESRPDSGSMFEANKQKDEKAISAEASSTVLAQAQAESEAVVRGSVLTSEPISELASKQGRYQEKIAAAPQAQLDSLKPEMPADQAISHPSASMMPSAPPEPAPVPSYEPESPVDAVPARESKKAKMSAAKPSQAATLGSEPSGALGMDTRVSSNQQVARAQLEEQLKAVLKLQREGKSQQASSMLKTLKKQYPQYDIDAELSRLQAAATR